MAKNLSLEDIAHATKIPKTSLAHLEAGRFEALPAPVFVRGFIRAYTRCVGVDPNPFVRLYEGRGLGPAAGQPFGASDGSGPDAKPAQSRVERRLDPQRRLVPLQPVSERGEGGLRGGFALLAVVAVGLLVAAWFLVSNKTPSVDVNARAPSAPMMHERIDGVGSLDAGSAPRPGVNR